MNMLSLRKMIANAMESTSRPFHDTSDVLSVEYVNPLEQPGPWALRITVDDGVGGSRVFRLDFNEEDQDGGNERYVVSLPRTHVLEILTDADRNRFPDLDSNDTTSSFFGRMGNWYRSARPKAATSYAGQIRSKRDLSWRTLGTAAKPYDAGQRLSYDMQRKGMRYSEIGGERGHIADMVAGHVLTAEDGTEFRIVAMDEETGK